MNAALAQLLFFFISTAHASTQSACEKYYSKITEEQRRNQAEKIKWQIENGDQTDSVRWSYTPHAQSDLLAPGVQRVGRKNIQIIKDRKERVQSVLVTLPNGKIHKIKISGLEGYKGTKEMLAEHIALLPSSHIHLLKKIRLPIFRNQRYTGGTPVNNQKVIYIVIEQNLGELLAHEFGHIADQFYFSKDMVNAWEKAAMLDPLIVSRYANTSIEENFAESVARYLEPDEELRQSFRSLFPNRTRFLDDYFSRNARPHNLMHNGVMQNARNAGLVSLSLGAAVCILFWYGD